MAGPPTRFAVSRSFVSPSPERVILRIGGMVCATCVETNEAALRALPGVLEASVNLGAEKAYVTYIPSRVTTADMRRAIEEGARALIEARAHYRELVERRHEFW